MKPLRFYKLIEGGNRTMIDIGLQFTLRRTAPSVPGPRHNRGFTISLTHTTLDKIL